MKRNTLLVFSLCLMAGFMSLTAAPKHKLGKFKLESDKDPDNGGKTKQQSIRDALNWRNALLVDENGQFKPSYFVQATQQADRMKNTAGQRSSSLTWEELGPGNVGGRTRAILYDNRDATRKTVYAGSVGGGLWKSTDGCENWTQVPSVTSCMAISCIAQDITGVIYFGTGEGLAEPSGTSRNSGTVGNGLHMLYGSDLDSILPATMPSYIDNTEHWSEVNRIAINPINPSNIFAATTGGLQVTNDGGQTWAIIGQSPNSISGLSSNYAGAADVKFSAQGTFVYASVGFGFATDYFLPGISFIMSSDFGNSWTYVPLSRFGVSSSERIEIATAPSADSIVYVSITDAPGGNLSAICKSADGGNSWTQLGTNGGVLYQCFGGDGQGWYDNTLAVNPYNSDRLYFGGTQLFTWTSLGSWVEASVYSGTPANDQWVHADMHAIVFNDLDSNEMLVGCDGGVFKSLNAYSLFPNPTYTVKNRGYGVTQNYSVAADQFGSVVGGAQDNGTNYVDYTNGATTYGVNVYGGDGVYAEISRFNPNYFVGGYVNGADYRSSNKGSTWVSMFDGVIDPNGADAPSICSAPYAPFVTAFWLVETKNAYNNVDSVIFTDTLPHAAGEVVTVIGHINQPYQVTLANAVAAGDTVRMVDLLESRLYFATYCGLFMTPDIIDFTTTPRWFRLTSSADDIKSLAATQTGDTIYIGNSTSVTRITGLNAIPWDTATKGSSIINPAVSATTVNLHAATAAIEGLDVDVNNPNHVLAAVAGYSSTSNARVYHSMDAGATWTALGASGSSPLPNMPVYQCVIDAYNSSHYIVGSELGIWDSPDAGATWTEQNGGINAREPVYRLRQQNYLTDGCYSLYAGTHGRGMWRSTTLLTTEGPGCTVNALGINDPKTEKVINGLNIFPNPSTHGSTSVQVELSQPSDMTLRVIDMPGRLLRETNYTTLQQGTSTLPLNTSDLANGTYLVVGTLANGQTMSRLMVVAH